MKFIYGFYYFSMLLFAAATTMNAQESFKKEEIKMEKVAEGLNFPEGPAWDGSGTLYVSNCYGARITRIRDNSVDTFVASPSKPVSFEKTNGLTVYKDGTIYACEFGLGAILKFSPDGSCNIAVSGYNGAKFNRPNDLAFDANGNLYFTDPKSYDPKIPDGVVYMLPEGKSEAVPVIKDLCFPNGIAFSADGKQLFVCESAKQRVLKYSVLENGKTGSYTVFAEMPGGDPDGIAFDTEGNLYVAHFGGGAVVVFDKDGNKIREIKTPGKKPSNVEFAGKDMKTLYITEDETNAVYRMTVDIPGLKLFSSPSSM